MIEFSYDETAKAVYVYLLPSHDPRPKLKTKTLLDKHGYLINADFIEGTDDMFGVEICLRHDRRIRNDRR